MVFLSNNAQLWAYKALIKMFCNLSVTQTYAVG